MDKKKREDFGALWLSKSGKFYTGKTKDGTKIIMFDNRDSKSSEKAPDFKIYVDDYEPTPRGGFDDDGGF